MGCCSRPRERGPGQRRRRRNTKRQRQRQRHQASSYAPSATPGWAATSLVVRLYLVLSNLHGWWRACWLVVLEAGGGVSGGGLGEPELPLGPELWPRSCSAAVQGALRIFRDMFGTAVSKWESDPQKEGIIGPPWRSWAACLRNGCLALGIWLMMHQTGFGPQLPTTPPTSASPCSRHRFQERSDSRSLVAAWREQAKTTLSLAGGLALRKEAMGLACLGVQHALYKAASIRA